MHLLEVENLNIQFRNETKSVPTVTDVSFYLDKGEILALVGESGCGKSVTCMALTRLLPSPQAVLGGNIWLTPDHGNRMNVLDLSPKELRKIRGGFISYVFQEPSVSLNPVFTIGRQIEEAIRLHQPEIDEPNDEVINLLQSVGMPDPRKRVKQYPHEMSGGMQQRVMIAMALACNPSVLVADEPTTALDVTIQAQILELLLELKRSRNMSIILVTHNLGIVSELADRVAVMYAGSIVETASVSDLRNHPKHPYSVALIDAVPSLGGARKHLNTIRGSVPSPEQFNRGCRFYGRCAFADQFSSEEQKICNEEKPCLAEIMPGHYCACHYVKPENIANAEKNS